MSRLSTPLDFALLNMEVGMMMAEAQAVIAMRVMGWNGLWSVTDSENGLMVSEKAEAMARATMDAATAAMTGKRPDQILQAAVKPLRQKTRANSKRLGKRGFKIAG